MIDKELQELAVHGPDRSLDHLEADVWAALAKREQAARRTRGLLLLQGAVLLFVLAGSLLAGRALGRLQEPGLLAIFSPHVLLGTAALPGGDQP